METVWVWIAAFLTIAIFTYLWRENPLYRFAEHIFVGISVGYAIAIQYHNILYPKLIQPMIEDHNFWLIIPGILGIMIFFRFSSKYGWVSYYPMAFIIGGAGYGIPAIIDAQFLKQIQVSINTPLTGEFLSIFSGVVIILGTLAGLVYFYFSVPHKGVVGYISKFGSMILMICFGASFGNTVMARISLLIGRLLFIYRDWLKVIE